MRYKLLYLKPSYTHEFVTAVGPSLINIGGNFEAINFTCRISKSRSVNNKLSYIDDELQMEENLALMTKISNTEVSLT